MAVFLHVSQRDPIRGRYTADVDAAVDRKHLPAIIDVAAKAGWTHRYIGGIDELTDADRPGALSAVHLFFPDPLPASVPDRTDEGILLAPVIDLVHMKLTSFRLKDRVHIQDLDGVGLIDSSIETQLSPELLARLAEIRASE